MSLNCGLQMMKMINFVMCVLSQFKIILKNYTADPKAVKDSSKHQF